ncbi:pyruvate kinase-like [Agrilus planipennis]|uniref:Pyruvate kinase n=1 Tax=Agrilus planipennis TaxID=224129 RepID=A0A1W4XFM4_AGRPL|nr:pyruvate kinase-like [Agrilus planipennis]
MSTNNNEDNNSGDNPCPKLPWMIDFHSKNEKLLNGQWSAAYADNKLEHLCKLSLDSDPLRCRMTKIMCTIGPSCFDMKTMINLMKAGVNIFRIKMSHTTVEFAQELVQNIRTARDKYSQQRGYMYNIAICFDLEGPGFYTGNLEDSTSYQLELREGFHTVLTGNKMFKEFVNEDVIYVSCDLVQEVVKPGDKVYLEHGAIVLEVLEIDRGEVKCIVRQGGYLTSKSTVDIPGIPIMTDTVTEKDVLTLQLAVQLKIDSVVLSEVRNSQVIIDVRTLLADIPGGVGMVLIPKIDFAANIDEFDKILELSDGIYFSRERLRIEITSEKLTIVQKMVIAKCNKAGKPICCASSLLESMITLSRPLKAELTDVANAVMDGADCLVLSRETSIGDSPTSAVKILSGLALEAESAVYAREVFQNLISNYETPVEPEKALAFSAINLSMRCYAAAIIVCTVSGKSARLLSRYRPRCPIIAVTRYANVAQRLNMWRGVLPFLYFKRPICNWKKDLDTRIQVGMTYAKLNGIVRAGDAVVVVKALRLGSGFTNSMQIVYASEFDALPPDKP